MELFRPRQSITGLYAQLHHQGFSTEDLLKVQEAYRLAVRLCPGRFRKTERAFICHGVGTASAVARYEPSMPWIIAGLIHYCYDSGLFPDGSTGGRSAAHRRWILEQVDPETESILYRLQDFDFDSGCPEHWLRHGCPQEDHDLLAISLMHELDDLADAGLALAPKYGHSLLERIDACAELARGLGREELADMFVQYRSYYQDLDWVKPLVVRELHGYVMMPGVIGYLRYRYRQFRGRHVKVQ